MPAGLLSIDARLRRRSRLSAVAPGPEARHWEAVALVLMGVGAALLTTFVDYRLRIPGHHILFAMFPLALGFALAPRRLAGTIVSGAAVGTLVGLAVAGAHVPGPGVLTGIVLAGPLLDLALRWGGDG